jgi:hypothetical protein
MEFDRGSDRPDPGRQHGDGCAAPRRAQRCRGGFRDRCLEQQIYLQSWRPITAIENANEIGNPGITQDSTWTPLLTTPAFPEYVAGHAVFSAAAAQALDNFFGDDVTFTATSESTPGMTFTFTPTTLADAIAQDGLLPGTTTLSGSSDGSSVESSFDIAAEQAGDSRVYGGIHFPFSPGRSRPSARPRTRCRRGSC